MNRNGSRGAGAGAGGRGTPSPRGRSSRSPSQSTNHSGGSPHVASGWRPRTDCEESKGAGQWTPSPQGKSSSPPFQSTNSSGGSPHVSSGWRPRTDCYESKGAGQWTPSPQGLSSCPPFQSTNRSGGSPHVASGWRPRMDCDESKGAGGQWTPSPQGQSSCTPFQSTNRSGGSPHWTPSPQGRSSCPPLQSTNQLGGSPHGGSGWQHQGFPLGHNVESSSCIRQDSGEKLADGISKQFANMSPLGNPYRLDDSPQNRSSHAVDSSFGKGHFGKNQSEQIPQEQVSNGAKSENLDQPHAGFDICQEKAGNVVKLKPPLHVKNKEKRNEIKRGIDGQNIEILSDGMVLLKSFISLSDQVRLVNTIRKLGIGPGGFYQPGYRDGAKLHLKMMCLGKNWDPETSQYSEKRPCDDAKPPMIPNEFHHLVQKAIQQSQSHLEKHSKCKKNIDDVLPSMSPNICIVNFYTTSGKLGLHQDKDESEESIKRGLPVVSFSIGDAAEFLYGNQRDPESANKVMLESRDVLVFGGKSRLIYHGVSSIKPNTASMSLAEETNLKPGRLNLTFRQY